MMNLPNKLTILRIGLTLAFIVLLFAESLAAKICALTIFLTASLTDALDGFLAKSTNQVTDFGKLMDPIADKILVLAAFLAFVELRLVPAWTVIIIIFREVAVTALRAMAFSKGKIIPSNGGGKHKTVWQMFVIFTILLYLIFDESGARLSGFWGLSARRIYKDAIFILMCITVLITIASGFSYFIKNKEVYADEKAH